MIILIRRKDKRKINKDPCTALNSMQTITDMDPYVTFYSCLLFDGRPYFCVKKKKSLILFLIVDCLTSAHYKWSKRL